MLMMFPPPCFIICLAAVLAQRKTPVRLTETTLFHSSREMSTAGLIAATPGIVDNDVKPPEILHSIVDQRLNILGFADVALKRSCPCSHRLESVRDLIQLDDPSRCELDARTHFRKGFGKDNA